MRNSVAHGVHTTDPEVLASYLLAAKEAILSGDYENAEAALRGEGLFPQISITNFFHAFEQLKDALRSLSEKYHNLNQHGQQISEELRLEMLWLPNLPHESVPDSPDEADNVPGPPQGNQRDFDFTPLPHWEIGPRLGIIDFERGVRLMGYFERCRGALAKSAHRLLHRPGTCRWI